MEIGGPKEVPRSRGTPASRVAVARRAPCPAAPGAPSKTRASRKAWRGPSSRTSACSPSSPRGRTWGRAGSPREATTPSAISERGGVHVRFGRCALETWAVRRRALNRHRGQRHDGDRGEL